ncbi:zf-HC2 domain-containing protein [Clostridium sp. YIM B02515]|uniref:Zf-HC2 domain-containing protein n=1 Tax=Clostridium rhizosphaerae TaxID=2803861 RepID=A0ABS1TF35_9CLOT|nr:zf-HC2 domain-containing protein [Clostridium rhizosphaerae]MBL4937856.1 zf-HC2 domain-containing protein [Clostridium rhizosphaerae]
MKISCEITKDLIPLYHDEVCSNQSRIAVEEHLQECDDCKKYLDSIDSDFIQVNTVKLAEQSKSNVLKGIKKKLFRKNVMISAISVICAFAVLFGGLLFVFHYQLPISYEKGLVSVKMGDNGMLDVYFKGNDYYCSYEWTTTIEKDGIKQNVAYIYYTDSIWTKYFSKPKKDREYKYSINNNYWFNDGSSKDDIEVKREISAVYYLDYSDIPKLSKEDLIKNSSKAVLIWEK